jgi:hypothetical protein
MSEANTFPLGPDEGFTFAYKIMNKNRTVLFDQYGYLNIQVHQVTEKFISNHS